MSRKKQPFILPPPPLPAGAVVPPRVGCYSACVVIATYETHSAEEQARLLGITKDSVYRVRSALIRAGLLDERKRKNGAVIDERETGRALTLLRQGMTLAEASEMLDGGDGRAWRALKKSGRTMADVQAERPLPIWSVKELALAMGLSDTPVGQWVARGWIRADRPTVRPDARHVNTRWRIDHSDVLTFLRDRNYWMLYEASAIVDAELRRVAQAARAAQPGRWRSQSAICIELGYSATVFSHWRRWNWPGPEWEIRRLCNINWVWVPQGAALPGPPLDRRVVGVHWRKREQAAA